MGNFDFAKATLPAVHPDCARAESYLSTDPRSACFYSRRAAEGLVAHLYAVLALKPPYKNDLAARTDDAAFRAKVGALGRRASRQPEAVRGSVLACGVAAAAA